MNVSGIRPLSGINRINTISVVPAEEALTKDLATVNTAVKHDDSESLRDTSKQTFSSSDLAKQYDSRKTYSLKGAMSDIRTLDVEKAISAMQKDTALMQYQYFVGNKGTETNEVNATRALENFEI
jgi:hypothetical protein